MEHLHSPAWKSWNLRNSGHSSCCAHTESLLPGEKLLVSQLLRLLWHRTCTGDSRRSNLWHWPNAYEEEHPKRITRGTGKPPEGEKQTFLLPVVLSEIILGLGQLHETFPSWHAMILQKYKAMIQLHTKMWLTISFEITFPQIFCPLQICLLQKVSQDTVHDTLSLFWVLPLLCTTFCLLHSQQLCYTVFNPAELLTSTVAKKNPESLNRVH